MDGVSDTDSQIEDMAARYVEAVQTFHPTGPYLLGGHSLGGTVAFEMARQLQARGQEVALLAILDTWGPASDPSVWTKGLRLTQHFLCQGRTENMAFLKDKSSWVLQTIRERVLLGMGSAHARHIRDVKKTNLQAASAYHLNDVYPGRLTLFRAEQQAATTSSDLQLGWGKFVAGGIEVHEIPGNHYTMFAASNIQIVAERLRACIERTQEYAFATAA